MPRRIININDEHSIQVACVTWFRYEYPTLSKRLFAVPNGGRRDAVTGARLKAEGVIAGVADLILLTPLQGLRCLARRNEDRQGQAEPGAEAMAEGHHRQGRVPICGVPFV